MDITFQPDQMVPAGRYIVILRPVVDTPVVPVPGEVNEGPSTVGPVPGEIMSPQTTANESGNGNGNGSMSGTSSGVTMIPGQTEGTIPEEEMENRNNNYMGGKRSKKQMKMTKKTKKGKKGTRKLSPYMKFAQEARPKILKENPNLKSDIIGVGRRIGEMWRALSDAEKARY